MLSTWVHTEASHLNHMLQTSPSYAVFLFEFLKTWLMTFILDSVFCHVFFNSNTTLLQYSYLTPLWVCVEREIRLNSRPVTVKYLFFPRFVSFYYFLFKVEAQWMELGSTWRQGKKTLNIKIKPNLKNTSQWIIWTCPTYFRRCTFGSIFSLLQSVQRRLFQLYASGNCNVNPFLSAQPRPYP